MDPEVSWVKQTCRITIVKGGGALTLSDLKVTIKLHYQENVEGQVSCLSRRKLVLCKPDNLALIPRAYFK